MIKISNEEGILFEEIAEDATTDCYNEDEQTADWTCILEENISCPCNCLITERNPQFASSLINLNLLHS